MNRIFAVSVFVLLAACQPQAVPAVDVADVARAQQTVLGLKNLYGAAIISADVYVKFCLATKEASCATGVPAIASTKEAAKTSIDAAETLVRSVKPGTDVVAAALLAAQSTMTAFQKVVADHSIGKD